MSKNLLDKACADALAARLQNLQPHTQPLWGRMTATEMLAHCNRAHEAMISGVVQPRSTTPKQYLLRWAVLYILPRYPKGAKAPKKFVTQGQVNEAEFAAQHDAFLSILHRFATHTAPIQLQHPYFGALSTREWGRSAYKHADHHLRQFGL